MTDKEFGKLLTRLSISHTAYLNALMLAEKEYKIRFGNYPSEVDDDFWIDSFCVNNSSASIEDVIKNAEIHKKLNK